MLHDFAMGFPLLLVILEYHYHLVALMLPSDPKKVYLFWGFQAEQSCLQYSYKDIFLDYQ